MIFHFRFKPCDKDKALLAFETVLRTFPEKLEEEKTIVDEGLNLLTIAWPDYWYPQLDALQDQLIKSRYVFTTSLTIIGPSK